MRIEDLGAALRITVTGDINRRMRGEELRRAVSDVLRTGMQVRLEIELHGARLMDLAGAPPADPSPGESAVHRSRIDIVAGSPASSRLLAMLDAIADIDATQPPSGSQGDAE